MAQPPSPPPAPPPDPEEGSDGAARIARDLAQSLGMDVGDLPPGAADAAAGAQGAGGEARLKLDRSGALLGIQKLKPVLAHGRADAEDAAAAVAGKRAAAQADAAATPPPGAPKRATLPPRIGSYLPPGYPSQTEGDAADVDEIEIPGGRFLFGEERELRDVPGFRIDALPVTNAAYERFVLETGHRPPLYWPAGHLPDDLRDHPVVGVDYFDALAYARWLEKDLPFEDEWERAARGTDGRVWPWGNDGDQPWANTARSGFKMTLPVGFFRENVSPDGVRDMVGNAWELTHSPAPGGGIVVRGGSWYDLAYHAKNWFRFAARPTARNGTIGFRCVRRRAPRLSEPREIDLAVVEAEIAARRGPQAPIDPSSYSADRRDLVPDFRRLRLLVAEKKTEEILNPLRAGASAGGRHEPFVHATDAVIVPAPRASAAPPSTSPGSPASSAGPGVEREHVTDERIPPARAAASAAAAQAAAESAGFSPRTAPAPSPGPAPGPAPDLGPAAAGAPAQPVAGSASGSVADAARARLTQAAEDAARAQARQPAQETLDRAAARTPVALWILLGLGFALLLGLLWRVLSGGSDQPDSPAAPPASLSGQDPEAPVSAPEPGPLGEIDDLPGVLPPYPAAGRAPKDGRDALLLDGATGTWIDRLKDGPWLLVFAGGDEESAALTRRAAHALHRRLDGQGVRVALVLPRILFEQADGQRLPAEDLLAQLQALGARDGLTVLLDPLVPDPLAPQPEPGRGAAPLNRQAIRELRYGIESPNAAVLLVGGEIDAQTSPAQGGMSLERLLPVARRAWEIAHPDQPAPGR